MTEANGAIRVMLVDDDDLVRRGLRLILSSDPTLDVVADWKSWDTPHASAALVAGTAAIDPLQHELSGKPAPAEPSSETARIVLEHVRQVADRGHDDLHTDADSAKHICRQSWIDCSATPLNFPALLRKYFLSTTFPRNCAWFRSSIGTRH